MDFVDDGKENIWTACSDGDCRRVLELIQGGQNVNEPDEYGYTPIHAAVSYCHLEVLQLLISHGANPNLRDGDGDCPLHVCESSAVAEVLLSHGADPTLVNFSGETIFDKALQEQNNDMIQFCTTHGFLQHTYVPPDSDNEEDYENYNVDMETLTELQRQMENDENNEGADMP